MARMANKLRASLARLIAPKQAETFGVQKLRYNSQYGKVPYPEVPTREGSHWVAHEVHDDAIELFNQELTFLLDLDEWLAIRDALVDSPSTSFKTKAARLQIERIITAIHKGYNVTVMVVPF